MHNKFSYHEDVKVKEDIPHFTEKFAESLNKEFGVGCKQKKSIGPQFQLNLSTGDMEGFGDLGELVEGVNARLL